MDSTTAGVEGAGEGIGEASSFVEVETVLSSDVRDAFLSSKLSCDVDPEPVVYTESLDPPREELRLRSPRELDEGELVRGGKSYSSPDCCRDIGVESVPPFFFRLKMSRTFRSFFSFSAVRLSSSSFVNTSLSGASGS